jgi:S1-C subfamily serine protease
MAVVAVAMLVGCGGNGDQPTATPTPSTARAEAEAAPQTGTDIPQLVKDVSPSVVAIAVRTQSGAGEGSGVVWDDHGRIVTNNHVVEGASTVAVENARGEQVRGRVVATDPRTDLAVVQVDGGDLPAATFAGRLPEVGSLALAMGSPLGFENTVTAGIVSGLDRSLPTGGNEPSLVGLIQTDAAISPGNSGGALVSADGQVMGINVAYLPPQQTGAVSIGFAIPATTVRPVVGQLIDKGRVDHPYLGVRLGPAATDSGTAVVVATVEPGGPADEAGVKPRDVVVRIDGREVAMIEDVYDVLRGHKPGDTIPVVVRRGDRQRNLELKLGRLPTPADSVLPRSGG